MSKSDTKKCDCGKKSHSIAPFEACSKIKTSATKKKIDFDSTENQQIKRKFVEREVKACFSYEMQAILGASADHRIGKRGQLEYPLPTIEDIENLYEYKCPECGEVVEVKIDETKEDCDEKPARYECSVCEWRHDDMPDQEPQEIFEWWIVTEHFYDKLKAKGEPVLEWGNNWYWGRTTTGQSIMMDSVISAICSDMEILDGQKYSWADKK